MKIMPGTNVVDALRLSQHLIYESQNKAVAESLLPKAWAPKRRYVEVSKGVGLDYQEMVVPYDDVRPFIKDGWSITRLSKLSDNYVIVKWMNTIIALEKQNEN